MCLLSPFGESGGRSVPLISLQGPDGLALEAIGYGAALRRLTVPDRGGRPTDVCLGYDTLREYEEQDGCLGAVVGRCANRIAGAALPVGGTVFPLAANEGPNTLHSGPSGFHRRIWEVYELSGRSVTFRLFSPHLDGGFPGNLEARVTYALLEGRRLSISYEAVCDRDTVVNLTSHSYWNLSGHQSGAALSQLLTLYASRYTPAGPDGIPTGALESVAGSALDFTRSTALGERIDDPLLAAARGYDHNYALPAQGLRPAARLESLRTGISMELSTTLPGLQLYTANYLTELPGKDGAVYRERDGVCLETQFYPDAVHHPGFPSPILRAGERYCHRSEYRFSLLGQEPAFTVESRRNLLDKAP